MRPNPAHRLSHRLMAMAVALSLAIVAIGGSTSGALAKPNDHKVALEAFVGDHLDALADCAGTANVRGCAEEVFISGGHVGGVARDVALVVAISIVIGLVFEAHEHNPDGSWGKLIDCVVAGTPPAQCIDVSFATKLGGPSLRGIARGVGVYEIVRDVCAPAEVVCDQPESWPHGWHWRA